MSSSRATPLTTPPLLPSAMPPYCITLPSAMAHTRWEGPPGRPRTLHARQGRWLLHAHTTPQGSCCSRLLAAPAAAASRGARVMLRLLRSVWCPQRAWRWAQQRGSAERSTARRADLVAVRRGRRGVRRENGSQWVWLVSSYSQLRLAHSSSLLNTRRI
jgi:hypothetical protein